MTGPAPSNDIEEWSPRFVICERRWPEGRARPIRELMATDGEWVWRLRSLPDHVAIQQFRAPGLGDAIIEQVEAGSQRAAGLQGYSSIEDQPLVAMMRTDNGEGPGWAAFGSERVEGASLRMPSVPKGVATSPTLRLAGGGALTWRERGWIVQGALEQKGETFVRRHRSLNLLDYVREWRFRGTVGSDGAFEEIELEDGQGVEVERVRVGPHRLETAFSLDEMMFREYRDEAGFQSWFAVEFDETLLNVPAAWRTFWMAIDLEKPMVHQGEGTGDFNTS